MTLQPKTAAAMTKLTTEQKLAKSERHDAEYMKRRKEIEASNIEMTLRLRALRRAMEQGRGNLPEEESAKRSAPSAARPEEPDG